MLNGLTFESLAAILRNMQGNWRKTWYNTQCDGDYSKSVTYGRIAYMRSFNPLTAKLFNLNFHPFEVVSR